MSSDEKSGKLFTVAITATIGIPSAELIRSSRRHVCYLSCIGHFYPGRAEGAVD